MNQILVQALEVPNIHQNPLSVHAKMNMLELIYEGKKFMVSHKQIVRILSNEEKLVNVADSMKAMSLIPNEIVEEKIQGNKKKLVLIVKGVGETVGLSPGKP